MIRIMLVLNITFSDCVERGKAKPGIKSILLYKQLQVLIKLFLFIKVHFDEHTEILTNPSPAPTTNRSLWDLEPVARRLLQLCRPARPRHCTSCITGTVPWLHRTPTSQHAMYYKLQQYPHCSRLLICLYL